MKEKGDFLNDDDLVEFTGSPRRARQIEWLAERGYPFEVNLAGRPVVLREVVRARLGGKAEARRRRPNFGAISGQTQN